jgi:hypothetical protein
MLKIERSRETPNESKQCITMHHYGDLLLKGQRKMRF